MGHGRGFGRGSGRFSGYSCIKIAFFAFNVIFWLLGCAMMGIGIWLHVTKGPYASVMPSYNFVSATTLCIAAGVVAIVVGFFGCCGAIIENQCMLLTYFLLVLLIFVMEVVAGILAFVFRNQLELIVKKELELGIQTKYSGDQGLREGWKAIQTKLQCCGVTTYKDWYKVDAWKGQQRVPQSCCRQPSTGCGSTRNPDTWWDRQCLNELKYWLKKHLHIVGSVGLAVGMIQVLGLIASMALFCNLRHEK